MVEHARVRGTNIRLETAVEHAHLTPVQVERLDVGVTNTGSHARLLEGCTNGTHGRLRSQSGHAW